MESSIDTGYGRNVNNSAHIPDNYIRGISIPNIDIEDIIKCPKISENDYSIIQKFIICTEGLDSDQESYEKSYNIILQNFRKKNNFQYSKSNVLSVYLTMVSDGKIKANPNLRKILIKKSGKSSSGVLVITVVTSPYPDGQKFSCEYNCYFCPNEPNQPRSYLHDEPSIIRANRNNFDPILQFYDRAYRLSLNGHPVDKIELIVLGGTWSSYPHSYQESFIRDLFYAANTFPQTKPRQKENLEKEKVLNENAECKIIGITLETRPDCINEYEIRRMRKFGCTRVQLGIQHTDNTILKLINRKCSIEECKKAIILLKNNCFKIDIHLMPNLPGSNPELDRRMFDTILNDPDLQVDQWKIYPCEIVPWTVIEKWNREGKYIPYNEEELMNVILYVKPKIHPWIRLNRIIRDIPSQYILSGIDNPSMRQDIQIRMKKEKLICRCIRCREIGGSEVTDYSLIIRRYYAQNGTEYFISFEACAGKSETGNVDKLLGFVRLRIPSSQQFSFFEKVKNCALIRELHVYGTLNPTKGISNTNVQHKGIGKKLMNEAEKIAILNGYTKIAVISGVGVRNFYRKLGYILDYDSEMMIKENIFIPEIFFWIGLVIYCCIWLSFTTIHGHFSG